jgi:hypothetical protein
MKLQDNERTGLDNARMIFAGLTARQLHLLAIKMGDAHATARAVWPHAGPLHREFEQLCDDLVTVLTGRKLANPRRRL